MQIAPKKTTTSTKEESVLLKNENAILKKRIEELKDEVAKIRRERYRREIYTPANLAGDVFTMESGLPTHSLFNIMVGYVRQFEGEISYVSGRKVDTLTLENQVFMALMKLRQNYTNLHLGQLFHCSVWTVHNVVLTFIHVLYKLLSEDIKKVVPCRQKSEQSMPESFFLFANCKMVIGSAEVGIQKRESCSHDANTFKVLIGVAPNGVITFMSQLYPSSLNDTELVQKSGVLDVFVQGDLILADKDFLIQDLLPNGVSLNIPNGEPCTATDLNFARNFARTHVGRAIDRLKDFRMLDCIPLKFKKHADKIVNLCGALVNCQEIIMRRDPIEAVLATSRKNLSSS